MNAITKVYDPEAYARRAAFKEVELVSNQKRLWEETRTALLWVAPQFTHILYSMLNVRNTSQVAVFTEEVPIAATDGISLILNPTTFFDKDLTLYNRVFICAHEILHCIFDHCGLMHAYRMRGEIAYPDGKKIPYNPELMNVAADYVINALLVESSIGAMPKDKGLHDTKIADGQQAVIDVYRKLYDDAKKNGGGAGGHGQGFDQHLAPGQGQGKDPAQTMQDRSPQEWDTQIAAAATAARAQGKMPAGLERVFGELLQAKVDWTEQIRALFARKVGNDAYDWRKLDRRLIVRGIGAPGRMGYGAENVVVAVDTSGSIGAATLQRFFAEMAGILEDVRPRTLWVLWADAEVAGVEELSEASDLLSLKPKGGGGTDFRPVFGWVHDQGIQVDALVYLTDGYGSFPAQSPDYPVIWGNISGGSVKYPFGDVVDVPVQA